MMNNILCLAIASALNYPLNRPTVDISAIPKHTFGVFLSIERSGKYLINPSNNNIHGSIGYWNPNYHDLDKNTVLDKIKKVANDSAWKDVRNDNFKYSLYCDMTTIFKIYFMLNPIQRVSENGTIKKENFNNKKYGIIAENPTNPNQSVTFLPAVFPDKDWDFVKEMLVKKGGFYSNKLDFYAYQCEIFSMKVTDYYFQPIQQFINKKYKNFVPHEIINDIVVIDRSESIRNLSVIYNILLMDECGYQISKSVRKCIHDNIKYYWEMYQKGNNMRQASAFLMLDMCLMGNLSWITIKNNLLEQLNNESKNSFQGMDLNLEMGEILWALHRVDPNNDIIKRYIDLIPKLDQDMNSEIDIFRYNWFSKSAKFVRDGTYKYLLVEKIIKYIHDHPEKDETNYLAVEFESLATLYCCLDDYSTKKRIEGYLEKLLVRLQERKNKFGFYQFHNGTVRLDITGHVMNGLCELVLNN